MLIDHESNDPFFIVGCERSGTTLTQLLINKHPRLAIPNETHILHRFVPFLQYYGELKNDCNLKRLICDLLDDTFIKRLEMSITCQDIIQELTDRTFGGIVNRILTLYAQSVGKARWGEKTPVHVMYLRELSYHFPSAKVIHIIRDGRDVAESLVRVWFAPPTVYGAALRWKNRIRAFQEGKKYFRPDKILEVRYEDIVADPGAVGKKIFAFLGEAPITLTRESALEMTPVKKIILNQPRSSHFMLNEAISTDKVGIHHRAFTKRQIEIFETIAKAELASCGYELESIAQIKLHWPEQGYYLMRGALNRIHRSLGMPSFFKKARLQLKYRKKSVP